MEDHGADAFVDVLVEAATFLDACTRADIGERMLLEQGAIGDPSESHNGGWSSLKLC